MDVSAVAIVIQLVFLEGILSIDNAAVLGAMVAHLPNDRPIPWPRSLAFLGRIFDPLLGKQREAALKVGLLGAYLGRGLMLLMAAWIIHIPWLRILGALYLLYLALSHFAGVYEAAAEVGPRDELHAQRIGGGFWSTVLLIELADLAFSLDNVIAAVSLSDEFWVVMLGVAIGILLMRFAATIFTRLINWEPALGHGAYLLLLIIGSSLLLEEWTHLHIPELLQFAISSGTLVFTVIVARTPVLRQIVTTLVHPLLVIVAMTGRGVRAVGNILLLPFRRHEDAKG